MGSGPILGAVLDDLEGGGRPEYFMDRGARAAERLFAAGLAHSPVSVESKRLTKGQIIYSFVVSRSAA